MVRKGKQATIKKYSRVRAPMPEAAGRREGGERERKREGRGEGEEIKRKE